MAPTSISAFAATQLELLDAELKAELAETNLLVSQTSPAALQRAGVAILNLTIGSQRTGLGGKTVLDLELDSAVGGGDIPEHGIRVGDIVGISEQPSGSAKKREKADAKSKGVEGVMLKITPRAVSVALDKEDVDAPGGKLWLYVYVVSLEETLADVYDSVKLANDITYKRMNQIMMRMQKFSEGETTPFMRVLFGQSSPTPVPKDLDDPEYGLDKLKWIDPTLNDSQKEAVKFALLSREVALIHGPPGTGKTHTLIELILQLLKQNLRLLVCGPSNISVDNIVERLVPHKIPIIRLGHPARLLPSVLNHSLDVLTRTSDAAAIVQDIRKEMDTKQASIRKTRSGRERREIYSDLKELRKDFRERERNCVDSLVRGSKVVLATLHGAGGFHLKNEKFDAVIIDEASQALEAQCWVPLIGAGKVVLAGDHLQLPPTIKSLSQEKPKKSKSKRDGGAGEKAGLDMTLETTLFDRLLALHGPGVKRMLTTQYRMHEKIMRFPSDELYEGKLIAAESAKARLLKDLPYPVQDTDDTREPLVFWDTQGGDFPEKSEDDEVGRKGSISSESKSNEGEAALVKLHVTRLIEAGVKAEDIAVVTPYNAQLALISKLLKEQYPELELGSVDGFQGREKEAVVVSLVRSGGEVGFLGEKRRLNVAMTRPKRHLCVIGDSETLAKGNGFLKRWMAFLEENADLRFATLDDVGG
jgi:DNA polymerase alpha-associated DNA helicase A